MENAIYTKDLNRIYKIRGGKKEGCGYDMQV